jgi:ribonuclease E
VAEEGVAEIEIVAAPPPAAPAYAGPTPANPFGGQAFDIFDMMDEVESRPVATVAPRASAPARAPEPVPEPATASEPVPLPQSASEPVVAAQAVLDIVELEEAAVTEPALPAEPPAPAPVIQPIVIGQDPAPPAAPKKGWWRK